jgi:hypothetical protein
LAASEVVNADVFSSGSATVKYYAYGSTYGLPTTFSVPGGTTFYDYLDDTAYFSITLAGDTITYDYLSDVTWSPSSVSLDSGGLYIDNGALTSSVSGIPAFTSVKLDPSSMLGSSGFKASNVTWNSGAIAVT